MRVRLLGPVSATVGDNEVRLGGRQQRAIFALLALEANQAVALHRLAHEVWRDEPPARSTLSLQSYISRLRRSIADAHSGASPDGAAPQLITRAPGWALLTPRESVDALHFVDLVAEGHRLIETTDMIGGSARLREALSLWSAEPFADLDDLPSAREASARLQGLRLDAIEVLFSVDLSAGRTALVADQARRFVEENPYRERAWGALMVALYRQGRQVEALNAAHQLRVALADGLGIDPSPESRALQEQILRQDPALALPLHQNTEAADRGQGGRSGLAPVVRQADPPFVGRGSVLTVLDRVVGSGPGGQGPGGLLVIEGPPGMGKSAVLNEFSERMLHAGGSVVRGAGAATGATPALWPWMSIVRQVAAATPHLLEGSGETGAAGALALLDPSVGLGGGARTAWGESDPGLARTRLYRAIVDLLSLAHRAKPLAIVLDDVQWADEDTVALLALAADELLPQGVLLVVALRSGEAPRLHEEIDTLVARHRRQGARLELDGLGVDDVLAIIRRAAPDHEGLGVAEAIRLRTGGNPLFITELVQLLVSERRLDEQSVHDVLPSGVRDVLKRRLDRLPDRTRLLLAFLALFDRAVDARLLAEVAGTTEDSTLDDCEAAVASSLLLDSMGGFILSHDLVRQTLEETISFSRKARMHARIAGALLPTDSGTGTLLPEAMAEIAHHLTLAESVVGAGAPIPYLIAVADDARARSAFRPAETALRTALELSSRIADVATRADVEAEIRSRLTLQSMTLAGSQAPASAVEDPAGGSAALSDPEVDPLVWWGGQILRIVVGRSDLALATAEQAIGRYSAGPSAALARSVAGLAAFGLGRLDAAEVHLQTAEALSAAILGSKPPWIMTTMVSSPSVRSGVAALRADWAAAADHERRARERAGASVSELVTVEYYAAWNAAQRGRTAITAETAGHTLELATDLGDSSHWIPMSTLLISWARAMSGDAGAPDEGHDAYLQCVANGMRWLTTVQLVLCAEGYAHHGHITRARQLVLQSRELEVDCERNLLGPRLAAFTDRLVGERH